MADLLETSSHWLEEKRTQHLSRTVTYQRGADTIDVPASIGRTTFEIDDGYGIVQKIATEKPAVVEAGRIPRISRLVALAIR